MEAFFAGLKVKFNAKKTEMQQEKVFSLLQDTEYRLLQKAMPT